MYSAYNELFENIRSEFLSALGKIDFMQTDILKKILKNNSYTNYGKKYSFEKIKTVSEYQNAVPVTEYKDYEVYIKEIMLGKKNVLTSEDVILLEPTGGSSGELKLIPYTKGLKNAFNNGIKPWLSDLFLNFPDIINRPMYWSITPKVKQQGVKSEVKIGFENDIDYLDIDFADIISKKIVIPPVLNNDDVIETSAVFLSQFPSLGLISVWSPSLLLLLVEKLKNSPKNIWKDLKLISCWDDGNSKMYFDKLKSLFPDVKIQGKGLLSTEALISVPIENMGKVPCFTSHFLEFTDIETKKLKLLQELEKGRNYEVIVTTQGGFYRYNTGDIINVYDFSNNCPLIKFIGRGNNISDYFGEKLNEDFVLDIISRLKIDINSYFCLFAPYKRDNEFFYVLYIEPKSQLNLIKSEVEFENELLKNFHYNYARKLNQLRRFRIITLKNGLNQYIEICQKKGQKIGDIKPKIFSNCTIMDFMGKFVS